MARDLMSFGREVDHIGTIKNVLQDLTGYATLAYELIQNADDAKATMISFDIRDDGLTVWNDAVFSDCELAEDVDPNNCPWLKERGHRCDFHSFRLIQGGDKALREGTTGAFGVGFNAVYQLADHPELISAKRHWTVDELERRITPCDGCDDCHGVEGTLLILPWADPDNPLRGKLNQPAPTPDDVKRLHADLQGALPKASIFLRHLEELVISVDGTEKGHVQREQDADVVRISSGDEMAEWLVLKGDFGSRVDEVLGGAVDPKRDTLVKVAVPRDTELPDDGLLYATLPTAERLGLPFLVNAAFYPAQDRRRILPDGMYGQWNALAIQEAAGVVARNAELIARTMGGAAFWAMARLAYELADNPDDLLVTAKAAFWEELRETVPYADVVATWDDDWRRPSDTLLVPAEHMDSAPALEALGFSVADPSQLGAVVQIGGYGELGFKLLDLPVLVERITESAFWADEVSLEELPEGLQTWPELEVLAAEIQRLRDSARKLDSAHETLAECALAPVLGRDSLGEYTSTYDAPSETAKLFLRVRVDDGVRFLDEVAPTSLYTLGKALCPNFDCATAVAAIEIARDEPLDEALRRELLVWLVENTERADLDEELCRRISALPLFPAEDGSWHALDDLKLPGGFPDPIGFTEVVHVEEHPHLSELCQWLGAERLDLETYARDYVPRFSEYADGSAEWAERWQKVVQLIADELGKLRDAPGVLRALQDLPLVKCEDGEFRSGSEVYFATPDVERTLGDYSAAVMPDEHHDSLRALYEWLGVADRPRFPDIVDRAEKLAFGPLSIEAKESVEAILEYLSHAMREGRSGVSECIGDLSSVAWLPGEDHEWHVPEELHAVFSKHLFESQGLFLAVSAHVQQGATSVLVELGVGAHPDTDLVVAHLLHQADLGETVNNDVYRTLNDRADDEALSRLKGKACLLLPSGEYVSPHSVCTGTHAFGRYRYQLGDEFRVYEPLMDRLGVKDKFDHNDAVAVLEEIADEYEQTKMPIEDDEDFAVLQACWQMLAQTLDRREEWVPRVQELRCVPNRAHMLCRPDRVFFDDRRAIAKLFGTQLEGALTDRPSDSWRAMDAAGVRRLSEAVDTRVVTLDSPRETGTLVDRLEERAEQLARVLQDELDDPITDVESFLRETDFIDADLAQVVHELKLTAYGLTSDVQDVHALFLPEEKQFIAVPNNGDYQWPAVASALVSAFDLLKGWSHASTVTAVLSAESLEAAAAQLDEFGAPELIGRSDRTAKAPVIEGFGGVDTDAESVVDVYEELPAPSSPYQGGGSSGTDDLGEVTSTGEVRAEVQPTPPTPGGPEDETDRAAEVDPGDEATLRGDAREPVETEAATRSEEAAPWAARKARRSKRRSMLRSYVLPSRESPDDSDDEVSGEEKSPSRHTSEIDRAGVDRVLGYETLQGREPEEQEHHAPGFDVLSRSGTGEVRYIEVKAVREEWSLLGVSVTPTQFKTAQEHRDDFWLYVVENVFDDDEVTIHCIRNPANRVDRFMFDDGWRDAADDCWQPSTEVAPPDLASEPQSDTDLPFFMLNGSQVGEAGHELGWLELDLDVEPDAFVVQVQESGLMPWFARGDLVVIEPLGDDPIEDGEWCLALPEGHSMAILRQWWTEREDDEIQGILLGGHDSGPIRMSDPSRIEILGRATRVDETGTDF